jgi:hypothetical protein
MDKLTMVAGRIIFALPFLFFGAGHLMNAPQMAGMVPAFIPGGHAFGLYRDDPPAGDVEPPDEDDGHDGAFQGHGITRRRPGDFHDF